MATFILYIRTRVFSMNQARTPTLTLTSAAACKVTWTCEGPLYIEHTTLMEYKLPTNATVELPLVKSGLQVTGYVGSIINVHVCEYNSCCRHVHTFRIGSLRRSKLISMYNTRLM